MDVNGTFVPMEGHLISHALLVVDNTITAAIQALRLHPLDLPVASRHQRHRM